MLPFPGTVSTVVHPLRFLRDQRSDAREVQKLRAGAQGAFRDEYEDLKGDLYYLHEQKELWAEKIRNHTTGLDGFHEARMRRRLVKFGNELKRDSTDIKRVARRYPRQPTAGQEPRLRNAWYYLRTEDSYEKLKELVRALKDVVDEMNTLGQRTTYSGLEQKAGDGANVTNQEQGQHLMLPPPPYSCSGQQDTTSGEIKTVCYDIAHTMKSIENTSTPADNDAQPLTDQSEPDSDITADQQTDEGGTASVLQSHGSLLLPPADTQATKQAVSFLWRAIETLDLPKPPSSATSGISPENQLRLAIATLVSADLFGVGSLITQSVSARAANKAANAQQYAANATGRSANAAESHLALDEENGHAQREFFQYQMAIGLAEEVRKINNELRKDAEERRKNDQEDREKAEEERKAAEYQLNRAWKELEKTKVEFDAHKADPKRKTNGTDGINNKTVAAAEVPIWIYALLFLVAMPVVAKATEDWPAISRFGYSAFLAAICVSAVFRDPPRSNKDTEGGSDCQPTSETQRRPANTECERDTTHGPTSGAVTSPSASTPANGQVLASSAPRSVGVNTRDSIALSSNLSRASTLVAPTCPHAVAGAAEQTTPINNTADSPERLVYGKGKAKVSYASQESTGPIPDSQVTAGSASAQLTQVITPSAASLSRDSTSNVPSARYVPSKPKYPDSAQCSTSGPAGCGEDEHRNIEMAMLSGTHGAAIVKRGTQEREDSEDAAQPSGSVSAS